MSLGARLSILAGLCFAAFCAAFAYVSVQASDTYFQDVTQELSAPMAMYVARDRSPFHDTAVDAGQFRELAATAMILNPAIELYALDAEGRIVAAAADIHSLARSHVDLAPVRQFISQSGKRPILGDDPREGNARRIFTAAAAGPADQPTGYIYAILDSGARQRLSERAWPAYLQEIAGAGLGLVLLAGLIVATLLYARVTRPLRVLAREITQFEAEVLYAGREQRPPPGDEIRRLQQGFVELRARVATQMQALQAADVSRREWIAHLSHDLRTPLAKLHAHLESALRREAVAAASERRESLARALLHCSEVRKLLGDLFESARLDVPSLELNRESFSLGELAQDTAIGLRDVAISRGVRVECDIANQDVEVVADVGLVQRLIDNLLTNAIKATRRDSAVSVEMRRVGTGVEIQVSDRGPGPTTEMLQVFNEGREPSAGSAGLGLRIVAQILRLHGMRAVAQERAGGGTTICLSIPAAPVSGQASPVPRALKGDHVSSDPV
jgi:signal transduction histidine kinase